MSSFWVSDTLRPGLEKLMPRIDAAVSVAFDAAEPIASSYARTNAPWRDVTGNARNGLMAKHIGEPLTRHTLVIYHTMPYGFFLEIRWSGRFAIIGPTTQYMGPVMAELIASAVRRAMS